MNEDKIKNNLEEIETINIELDHRVSNLIAENEHLKQTYKQLYDSIKLTRIRSKEQCDVLINQVNQKSVEIYDLNTKIQEQGLTVTTLKDKLRKLKGKDLADNVVCKHNIDPEMLKIDVEYLNPRLLNNSAVEPKGTANVHHYKLNANSEALCVKCNGCMLSDNHDLCVLNFINDVDARTKSKSVKKSSKRSLETNRKSIHKYVDNTRIPQRTSLYDTPKHVVTLVYSRKPKKSKTNVPVSKPKNIKSLSANKKEPSKSWGSIVSDVPSSSLDECRNVTISRGYYVEGLGHNLFSVGQFYDLNLEVAFRHNTCFIRNLEGGDLLTGSRGKNLYTLLFKLYGRPNPICLLLKASKTNVDRPAPEDIASIAEVVAPEPAASTGSHSSTTVDQDAPSPSNSQTTPETQSHVIPNDVEEDNHDLDVAHMNNDPFFGIPIPGNDSEASSSSDVIPIIVHTAVPNSEHVTKWTKDHPLDNIIGDSERPVFTRLQLHEQALFCYYVPFITTVEPKKTIKIALTQACWIEAMKRSLIEFEHLETTNFTKSQRHLYKRGIFINQSKYALESLKKYGMESSDPVDTPMVEKSKLDEDTQWKAVDPTQYHGMIGTLMYLTASRPDLTFVVCMCARSQLTDYGLGFNKIPMYNDNKIAIALCCNNVQHSQSKHIDIRFYIIKEQVENGVVKLYFVNTEYQLADIFTKALCRERIEFLINKLGMRSFTLKTLKHLADEAEE
ncbi:hypothetical protein Tco_0080591 [Tanacetum coccineum]